MSAAAPRPLRVVLTGSECTGKTTLATELAAEYGAILVPEYSREYAAERGGVLGASDVEPIARGQLAREGAAIADATRLGARLIVQDTDLLSTAVYARHYYGECPPTVGTELRLRAPDLYLLLEIDVPWIADGVRDRGDRREELQQLFRDAVAASGVPSVLVTGGWDGRRAAAHAAINTLLQRSA